MSRLTDLVDKQAKDEGLWFVPVYASEDYLQRALRELHAAIEGEELIWRDAPSAASAGAGR